MRGKVTADAYSGGGAWGVETNWGGGELVGGGSGVETRVGGFAMRGDDWDVTRCCDLYGGDLRGEVN